MSAKRIIAVAEAMMRQSRRAGGVFALLLALLGFAPVGWFGWKWLRDRPNPGRLGLLARLFFLGAWG
jgi:hypothetical protein